MKKLITVFTVIIMAVLFLGNISNKEVMNDLFLDNVEALATGEFGRDTCIGDGNVTCSTGEKVEYVITPYNWN